MAKLGTVCAILLAASWVGSQETTTEGNFDELEIPEAFWSRANMDRLYYNNSPGHAQKDVADDLEGPSHEDGFKIFNVGVLMASKLDTPFDIEKCGPAVDMALEEINRKFLAHHKVRLVAVRDSYPLCSGSTATGKAADLYFKKNVIAFIGPACAFALEPVAKLASYWNVPIITGIGDQPPQDSEMKVTSGILGKVHKWRNKTSIRTMFVDRNVEYTTLTRTSFCQCRLRLVFSSIFNQYGWKHVALLIDRANLFTFTMGKHLEYGLRDGKLLTYVKEFDGEDEILMRNYLKEASMHARVMVVSIRPKMIRKFMLTAHQLNMTNGDWAFLDLEIYQGVFFGDANWMSGDEEDPIALKAYESLLRVSLLLPTTESFQNFSYDVKMRADRDYGYEFNDTEDVHFFVGAFYDGVYLLGMALNETLTEGGDIHNGYAITRRMWNREFYGITGNVRIDDNGDRDADYSLLDLNPETGKFSIVAHYYGAGRTYAPVPGSKIHWPQNKKSPPPDIPKCGFLGNDPLCMPIPDETNVILYISIGFGIFLAFVTTLTFIAYKHMRLSADLNNMSWRIRPEEVLVEGKPFGSKLGLQKINNLTYGLHSARASIVSCNSLPLAQVYTTIGIFKGNRVAIKKVIKKKVDLNKKLLWEIKQVRDVSHENTVRFVGACIDCPVILILTEYCPKGSLRDVLNNDALKLDWNFRMSLIQDIVKGMSYLHNSEVMVHGRLRSYNCLIDGRFVLKISDFGISTLMTPTEMVKDHNYYNKLLWIAPELLPLTVTPGIPATQKGDVYSFGIILEEIVMRGGPFEVARQFLEPQEIMNRVCARESPPFRPTVEQTDCPESLIELMDKCWNDNPDERPSFDSLKVTVRCVMKGYCENLMDDLLKRMEQYANNLETLVEEKTEQLSLEKKRSEELLYQVLPRLVAQQLMAGEMVQPEQFECVTIYFSDIVSFTSLCAQSTPMEVVDLLNDLYSTFDRIIGFYDVYKVETIGDAYMVVSGLPERNGDNHAREICLMALAILDAVKTFTVRHRPEYQLKIRIGIHSGPVCAGVVGVKMPHFCLFGDTVNTASRMESAGIPLMIHLSDATKQILNKFGTFKMELRGEVELKGKGRMMTYWLIGCSDPDPRPPTPILDPNEGTEMSPFPLIFPAVVINKNSDIQFQST